MFKQLSKSLIKFNYSKLLTKNFSARNNLVECFKAEVEFEEKEYKPISAEEKKIFFANSGFEFTESKTTTRMELKKTAWDFNVSICYHARSPLPEDEETKWQEQQGPTNMTDFQVLIQKVGKTSGFLVEAVVMESTININQVHVSENIQEYHSRYLTWRVDPDFFQGPDFSTLDDNL